MPLISSLLAVVGVALLGLCAGDPRGARSVEAAAWTALVALLLAFAVGAASWRLGRRRQAWLLAPSLALAATGALSGWIAGVEILGDTAHAAHLDAAPGRVAFLVAFTSAGMALPPAALAWLAGVRRPGRART
jgi:hypothetical protein